MKRFVILLIVVICVTHGYGKRYALLVGNSKGSQGYSTLKYVKNDINEMRKVFKQFCGFKEDNILSLMSLIYLFPVSNVMTRPA